MKSFWKTLTMLNNAARGLFFPIQAFCILHVACLFVRSFMISDSRPIRKSHPSANGMRRIIKYTTYPTLDQTRTSNSIILLTHNSALQVSLNSNQTDRELKRYQTRVAILQHEINHTEKELRRYQTRGKILQHELNERDQELQKYYRRVQILQDILLSKNNEHQASVQVTNDFEEANHRLSITVEQLRSKIFFLEQQTLKDHNNEIYALQQALQKMDILLKEEREKNERDQQKKEKELYAANQEILKVENALFAMEKELKARQLHWDRQEDALQDAIEKERNDNRRIKEELRTTREKVKQGLLEYGNDNDITPPIIQGLDATEITKGVVASKSKGSTLSAMEEELQRVLREKNDWEQKNNKQKRQLREQEGIITELKSTIRLQDEKILHSEEKAQKALIEMAALSAEKAREIRIMQQEKEKLAQAYRRENEQLLASFENKRSQYEHLLDEERDSLRLQITSLNKQISDLKNERLEKEFSSDGTKGSRKARVQTFFRWLNSKSMFHRIRNSEI